ncbi:hypothetical protein LCGC14_2197080, partial [marine sediment metagenome]
MAGGMGRERDIARAARSLPSAGWSTCQG